ESVPGAVATGSVFLINVGREDTQSHIVSGTDLIAMWNDTDIPFACLITFRCHGTWLHGDARGSIDRFHNRYKSPYIPPNEKWLQHNTRKLTGEPLVLNKRQRKSVEFAMRETCAKRKWSLHAINGRT